MEKWNKGDKNGGTVQVPIVPMSDVLRSIPEHVPIEFIMTDMQGHDLTAFRDGIKEISSRAVPYIKTEVNFGKVSAYNNSFNDICDGWLPLMEAYGYRLIMLKKRGRGHNPEGYGSHNEAVRTCRDEVDKSKDIEPKENLQFYEGDALWVFGDVDSPNLNMFKYPVVQEVLERKMFSPDEYDRCNHASV